MFTVKLIVSFTGEQGYKINRVQFIPTTLCKKLPALLAAGHTHLTVGCT